MRRTTILSLTLLLFVYAGAAMAGGPGDPIDLDIVARVEVEVGTSVNGNPLRVGIVPLPTTRDFVLFLIYEDANDDQRVSGDDRKVAGQIIPAWWLPLLVI